MDDVMTFIQFIIDGGLCLCPFAMFSEELVQLSVTNDDKVSWYNIETVAIDVFGIPLSRCLVTEINIFKIFAVIKPIFLNVEF